MFGIPLTAKLDHGSIKSMVCHSSCPALHRDQRSSAHLSNIYIPVLCALWGFSARGWCSNGQGRDNARAEGECIIRSRPLLHCPSAL